METRPRCPKHRIVILWKKPSKRTVVSYLVIGIVLVLLILEQHNLNHLYGDLEQNLSLEALMHAPPSIISRGESNSTASNTSGVNAASPRSSAKTKGTKIIGFSDHGYTKIAHRWYIELEALGYREHMVAAQDTIAAEYFASVRTGSDGNDPMRYDLVYNHTNAATGLPSQSLYDDCKGSYKNLKNEQQRKQRYRRTLFGSRWTYVLHQLEAGYNVLLTDVDNVYAQYKPMSELEESEYDIFHAYAGTVPSFPLNLFRLMGLTLCGGMSWLRSTPSVIEFVQDIVKECGCMKLDCECFCDDQVVVNKYIYYHYIWYDRPMTANNTIFVPTSLEEMSWKGYIGYSNLTGHKVKIWDRDVAYRDEFNENTCPDKTRNWIAMPTGLDRLKTWDIWNEKCLGIVSKKN